MKKLSYFASLAAILLFGACSSDVDEFSAENNGKQMTINVGMPGDGTRVHFDGDILNMVWSANDQIHMLGGGEPAAFTIAEGANTASAKFNVTVREGDNEVAFWGSKVAFNGTPDCKYLGQVQTAANDFSHIKDHLYMTSGAKTQAELAAGVKLAPQCAIMKLNIKSLPEALKNATEYAISFNISKLGAGNAIVVEKNIAKVTLNGALNAGDNFIYLAIPETHSKYRGIQFEISANDKTAKVEYYVSGGAEHFYNPGMIYTATLNYDADKDNFTNKGRNDGVWRWYEVSEGTPVDPTPDPEPGNPTFKTLYNLSMTGNWTEEGVQAQNKLWSNDGTTLKYTGENSTADFNVEIESRYISPVIELGTGNSVNFDIIRCFFSDPQIFKKAKVEIREVQTTGNTAWEPLTDLPTGGDYATDQNSNSYYSSIDTKYDKKKVQLSFHVFSMKYNYFDIITFYGNVEVNNFKVSGTK